MANNRIKVVSENSTGRNTQFKDNRTGDVMSRAAFVKKIEAGGYPKFHVRKINGVKTPVSNPDNSDRNNLG
jgi:hypothetical protein